MKKLLSITILLTLTYSVSLAQSIDNDNFIITHGPYLQNLGTTGVTIIWATNKPTVPGVILTSPEGKTSFVRNNHDGIVDGGGLLQKVRIDGLEPGKKYKYNISSVQILKYQAYKVYYGDTLTGKAESFSTYPVKSEKLSFTVINDVHENSGKLASYLKNGNSTLQDFYFFNGDMVDFLQTESQLYTGFIDTAVTYFASTKQFYYVRGNHETRGFDARDIKNHFDYKDDKFYYSFDNGPVHFVVLDCGEDKPDNNKEYYGLADYNSYRLEELEWLKKEVMSDAFRNARNRIIVIHMPILVELKQAYGMKFLADNYGPVLQTAKVDLMLSAHTHRNAFYEASKSGFGYPLLVNSNNSFVEIVVENESIKASVKDVTGKLISEYKIK